MFGKKGEKFNHLLSVHCGNVMVQWWKNQHLGIIRQEVKTCEVLQTSVSVTQSCKAFISFCVAVKRGDCCFCSLTWQWLQELSKNTLNWSPSSPGHTYLKANNLQFPVHIFYVYCRTWSCNEHYMYYVLMHKLFH